MRLWLLAALVALTLADNQNVQTAVFPVPDGTVGPAERHLTEQSARALPYRRYSNLLVTTVRVHDSIVYARQALQDLRAQDDAISANPGTLESGDDPRELVCQAYTANYSDTARSYAEFAYITTAATQELYALGPAAQGLSGEVALADVSGELESCPKRSFVGCLAQTYRSVDGLCNNVQHAWWGARLEPFRRDLPATFNDGVFTPRVFGVDGSRLPSPAAVVEKVHRTPVESLNRKNTALTGLVFYWSNLVYEDMVRTSYYRSATGTCIDCCSEAATGHPFCDVAQPEGECTVFTRFLPGLHTDCRLLPSAAANLASSFLDGSAIYGATREDSDRLRSFEGGRMKTQLAEAGFELPPAAPLNPDKCRNPSDHLPCFDFGAYELNADMLKAALSTVLVRQHNRVAAALARVNAHWDDTRLFEEARRVVVAQVQHITYNEYLPVLLGLDTQRKFGLELETHGAYFGHDHYRDATATMGFLVAGRHYLSMVADPPVLAERLTGVPLPHYETHFNNHWLYFAGKLEEVVVAATRGRLTAVDRFLSDILVVTAKNALTPPVDLADAMLTLGRVEGVQTFAEYRRACALPVPATFDDLRAYMDDGSVAALQDTYKNVADIDLYSGGLSELPVKGGAVGPTFACILANQFQAGRSGDRYWYENYFYPSAFSEDQLAEIRKTSLAAIICRNSGVETMQPRVFEAPNDFENCPLPCDGTILADIDFSVFADPEPRPQVPISEETISQALAVARQLAFERDAPPPPSLQLSRDTLIRFAFFPPLPFAIAISRVAVLLIYATEVLVTRQDLFVERLPDMLDENVLQNLLPAVDVREVLDQLPVAACLERTWPCDHTTPFRAISGWCNNLDYPSYGSSISPYRRLAVPHYDDGFSSARTLAADGSALPSARTVSFGVHAGELLGHPRYTQFLALYGRMIQLDVCDTPRSVDKNGRPHDCRACDSAKTESADCLPIAVPADDPFFIPTVPSAHYYEPVPRCLGFSRSLLGQLTLGYRQQMNQATSFLDMSFLYGSTDCLAARLRLHRGGLLNYAEDDIVGVTLPNGQAEVECAALSFLSVCFFAGTATVNLNPGVASLVLLGLRQHNNVANLLAGFNPHWHDERLYQEARRIVIAGHQHITYTQWLPKVIGYKVMDEFDLLPESQAGRGGYDGLCDASASNEVIHAVLPFLLSIENASVVLHAEGVDRLLPFEDFIIHPELLHRPGFVDSLLAGLARAPVGRYSGVVSFGLREGVTDDLEVDGTDVLASTIQRGRDHGLPPYAQFVDLAGGDVPSSFDDLLAVMEESSVAKLRAVYSSVADVDALTGIILERPLRGALVGPTAARLLANEFRRLRYCDRFWYENGGQAGSFSDAQLGEIRRGSTLATAVCTVDESLPVEQQPVLQPDLFVLPDDAANCPVTCDRHPPILLRFWQEACVVGGETVAPGTDALLSPCVSCTCTADGTLCHSFRVRNCVTLFESHPLADITADDACVAQCYPFIRLEIEVNPHRG